MAYFHSFTANVKFDSEGKFNSEYQGTFGGRYNDYRVSGSMDFLESNTIIANTYYLDELVYGLNGTIEIGEFYIPDMKVDIESQQFDINFIFDFNLLSHRYDIETGYSMNDKNGNGNSTLCIAADLSL